MKKIIIILVAVLIGMEGLGWWVYKKSKNSAEAPQEDSQQKTASPQAVAANGRNALEQKDVSSDQVVADDSGILAGFPGPSVERVGDIDERTIHMGVRQWEWVPVQLTANFGEKVRLVMHNADVLHSISIPDLGVSAYIPEDGAVVEFMADRQGTFDFFCNTPCGKDHAKMRGKITIS